MRNRVIEIRRFTNVSSWHFIRSEDMIADKGTRRCTSLDEIDMSSELLSIVRRSNKQIIESEGTGVVMARSN